MKKNVGKIDKIIRIVFGATIILIGIFAQSWWGLVGLGMLLPAIMGSYPLYSAIGFSSNKAK